MASMSDNYGVVSGKDCTFPAGVRVLVVDDDFTWLKIVEQMLTRCNYSATTCSRATAAINLLRERKCCFDLVLIDVQTPDMDGFKLLELAGLEMNLPVIMMSAYGRTSAIIRGIRHGACDYLVKPIHEENLKNIWQHVVRKKCNETKKQEIFSSLDKKDRNRSATSDLEHASAVNEDGSESDDEISASEKPIELWSVELHQKFVIAVNQLGIDKAVPKKILKLMNVPGLTRENVASHLQRFRLYFRRLSVPQQQMGMPFPFYGHVKHDPRLSLREISDPQTLAASRPIPLQTLTDLHAELLGRPVNDQKIILQGSRQGQKNALGDAGIAHQQPISLLWGHFLHIFPAIFLFCSVVWLIIEL
ncbi:hypothetical protein ACET3Z_032360 [Daucus carota]